MVELERMIRYAIGFDSSQYPKGTMFIMRYIKKGDNFYSYPVFRAKIGESEKDMIKRFQKEEPKEFDLDGYVSQDKAVSLISVRRCIDNEKIMRDLCKLAVALDGDE